VKINLKSIFCNHLYKYVEQTYLHEEFGTGLLRGYVFEVYAIKLVCIKCGKIKYETVRSAV